MINVVTANVWMLCQNTCSYCVAHVHNRQEDQFDDGREFGEVLDVYALLRWIDRFKPTARLHISGGGEALLYENIEEWIETVIKSGRRATLFTNGQLIYKRPKLHNLPINWIVTYHKCCGISIKEYAEYLAPIKGRNVEVRTIITRDDYDTEMEFMLGLRNGLQGFSVLPRYASFENKTARVWGIPKMKGLDHVASRSLTLIENNGKVYPCNGKKAGPVGDVYAMTYNSELVEQCDSSVRVCAERQWCGALNTALWEKHLEDTGVWK